MLAERYKVPAKAATATLTEKKSEFIAQLAPAATEDAALAFLDEVRGRHRTASHNVYAYVLHTGARARYSDDGEPAKTAGLPVLSAIQHAGLFNCIIVVTRYFGGTLLGTGGLVRAYTGAASAAIALAGAATIRPLRSLTLTLPYPLYEQTLRLVQAAEARLEGDAQFAELVTLTATLPDERARDLMDQLTELYRGGQNIQAGPPFEGSWEE